MARRLRTLALKHRCQSVNLPGIVEGLNLKLKLFWICWSVDVLICLIILVFFSLGVFGGSVSSFNIGLWMAILAVLGTVMGGSLWLKTLGYPVFATLVLLLLAIPGVLYGLFILLLVLTKTSWN
jgi:hypothetical protein